jgi:hypothetical protein
MPLDNDDIKQLIAILQKGLTTESNNTETQAKPRKKRNKQIPKISESNSKTFNNKFENMSEFNMHKQDSAIDKKIIKPPPSIRNRKFNYVQVKCRVCGKQEKVPATLVESIERYKCNKCSIGEG